MVLEVPSKPFFPLTTAFFGLNPDYNYNLSREIFDCVHYLKMSYSDAIQMPTYLRKRFFDFYSSDAEERKKKMESVKNKKHYF